MIKLKTIFITAVAVMISSQAIARDQIKIVGSSTVYPYTTVVAERFGKQGKFKTPVVESTGTGGGFKSPFIPCCAYIFRYQLIIDIFSIRVCNYQVRFYLYSVNSFNPDSFIILNQNLFD